MFAAAIIGAFALAGCGKEKVSFNTLEDARGTARANAEWNAATWRAQTHAGYDIVSRGDSTQTPECPQGDGWASIDLIHPNKRDKVSLVCSTVSGNIGCLEKEDFKSKKYSNENNNCQSTDKVPFPLPKIAK
jgi:hypothetical protein